MARDNGSLVVAGSGIKFMSHLSTETIAYIKQSDKVIYSLNEPAIEAWIKKNNSNVQSLNFLENDNNLRIVNYQTITNYIIEEVKKKQHVCVVFYGHPTVFAKSALDAVVQLEKENYDAKILPAISSEDCLFADLRIDPGSDGCQSYEATDFLIRRKKIDPTSHLILWQIGLIGAFKDYKKHENKIGLRLLVDYLA
jgi:tetrapyrrole methylase family protein/MazG family protein